MCKKISLQKNQTTWVGFNWVGFVRGREVLVYNWKHESIFARKKNSILSLNLNFCFILNLNSYQYNIFLKSNVLLSGIYKL